MMDHEKNSDLKAHMKRKDEEYFGQAFVDLKKSHEDDLRMGKIDEEIIFEEPCNLFFYSRIGNTSI